MKASLRLTTTSPGAPTRLPASMPPGGIAYQVRTSGPETMTVGDGPPAFTLHVASIGAWNRLWHLDAYRAGMAFLRGDVEVEGDLVAAIGLWSEQHRSRSLASALLALLPRLRLERWWQTRRAARRNIAFHYDRSNDFYRTFLDHRLVYSCAYFERPDQTLDEAQEAKLDLLCRKLDVKSGDTFLDVGCGWGALVTWAVERYGARAVGCTLSQQQQDAAVRLIGERGLADRASVALCDYRDVRGRFSKIASVGMVEHVGRARLTRYFTSLADRLEDSGLLLNHGIARPSILKEDSASHFLQRRVFPGGELAPIGEMIRAAEQAGFETLDLENLRPHYAMTCRAWVERLQTNRDACIGLVGAETYRTWLLYLASSSASFADGTTEVYQLLLAKRSGSGRRHLSRRYMYQT